MIRGEIALNDILYDPITDSILEVAGFGKDDWGQEAIFCNFCDNKERVKIYTAFLAFKHMTKLGKWNG